MQEEILKFIKKNPKASLRQIAHAVNSTHSGVQYHILKLTIDGKIRQLPKAPKWEVL